MNFCDALCTIWAVSTLILVLHNYSGLKLFLILFLIYSSKLVLFLIFRSESTCVIHIPDGFILYHYLTGNVVKCRQKQRAGKKEVDSKHCCELAGGGKICLCESFMRKKIVSTHLLTSRIPTMSFGWKNTENEHDFCSFPQGDFKVKRNASAYKFSEEYQSCAKLFVVTYKSDKLPQVFSRHHLGLKTNKICVCGVKRSKLTGPAEG